MTDQFPLSLAQERLWFVEQMRPGTPLHHMAGALRLDGPLDAAALARALRTVVARHEPLRTSFVQRGGGAVQRVHDHSEVAVELRETDLRDPRTGRACEAAIAAALAAEAGQVFDLAAPGLLRARLLRTGEAEHVLALVIHHLVADGWSIGVLVRELQALYDAFAADRASPLAELEIQYVDYAAWQRAQLDSGALAAGLVYWTRQLAGAPARLALPERSEVDAGASGPSENGGLCKLALGFELSQALRELSRREGVTMFVTLLAGFHALLARTTGQRDVIVGSPIVERQARQTHDLIGLFVNLVALRARVDDRRSFRELLRETRATVLDAHRHQDVPFEAVVQALGRPADPQAPLVQVVFAWQSGLPTELSLGAARGRAEPIHTGTAKFDLTLALDDVAGEIAGSIEYRSELYEPARIEDLARHLVGLLRAAVAAPDLAIAELAYLGAGEQAEILARSRGAAAGEGEPATVLALFARQVAERPDAVALEHDGRCTRFDELDREADALGRRLVRAGIAGETLVGVCMERTPAAVVAMLAVLKAGGAYVPLDPAYPPERLRYMIGDAGLRVVCTQRHLRDRFGDPALALVIVDDPGSDPDPDPGPGPAAVSLGRDVERLAYVIYTSGSTGRPKGVEVTHRGLGNLCAWHQSAFGLGPSDRTTQVASLSFDASVWEIWSSLCAGATLCFPPPEIRLVAAELRDWLVDQGITSCFLPTPLAEGVIQLAWPANTRLRWMLTGGDRLRSRSLASVPFALVNNYGPTEAAVVATSGLVPPAGDGLLAPSIGAPIRGAQVFVLDGHLGVVPAGVVGELYVGGEGVARGYHSRPELTAERFIPDPFAASPGARVYRTGDLGYHDYATGEIVFRGRADEQVKLRGHRIEPGEIAAVLKEAAAIDDAIVLVAPAPHGDEATLVAYVTFRGDAMPDAELRRHVRQRLPDYMVPARFEVLDALPLTPNGKLDRAALLARSLATASAEPAAPAALAACRTPTEETIAAIWSSLLARRDIAGGSNFFELGGHSLLAAQMIVRLRDLLARDIPLRAAFDHPVLHELAAHLDQPASERRLPSITPIARSERMPLSPAQDRLWFLDRFTGSRGAYNIAGAVRFEGALERGALEHSLQAIVLRHETLRSSFREHAGAPYLRIHSGVTVELPMTDLRDPTTGRAPATAVETALRAEAGASFDLERPGLIRARLLQTGASDHVLSLVVHHIVADGWSIGVLVQELKLLYEAFTTQPGAPAPLPPLAIQYVDYAAWQRAQLASGAFADGIAYWKRQLAGAPALELPSAEPRTTAASYGGGTVKLELAPGLAEALRELSRREGATLFMTLLAGVTAVLARHSGQRDVVVGTDMANRTHAAVEPLIGMFVNQLVLRSDLTGDPSFREIVARLRPVVLAAWAHQDVPFGTLVEALRPPRELGKNPLFQTMVILQNTPQTSLDLPGLRAEPIELDPEGSVFDLTFAFVPRATGALTATLRHAAFVPRTTAEQLLADLRGLLERATQAPETRLTTFEVKSIMKPNPPTLSTAPPRRGPRLADLQTTRPRAATLSTGDLVALERLDLTEPLPLVIRPRHSDVDLAAWAAANRARVHDQLVRIGAVLFRDFAVADVDGFRSVVQAIAPSTIAYGERSSPRSQMIDGVYTSTDHPADQPILLHNEQSYTLSWPRQIWFFCVQPAVSRGRTPIADSRRILGRLRPKTVARFVDRNVMYMRNYGDGLGLPWSEAFQTTDRAQVEAHCRRAGIELAWKDGDRLRTFQVRPAVRNHPVTGEPTWFNHLLFFHITSLPPQVRDAITAGVAADDLPFNTFYGDGSPIEPEVLDEIRAAYDAETRSFAWQRGDILVLDNMLTAHGREPFEGPRTIAVAMTDPHNALAGAPREDT